MSDNRNSQDALKGKLFLNCSALLQERHLPLQLIGQGGFGKTL
jgi:hypothetical protein